MLVSFISKLLVTLLWQTPKSGITIFQKIWIEWVKRPNCFLRPVTKFAKLRAPFKQSFQVKTCTFVVFWLNYTRQQCWGQLRRSLFEVCSQGRTFLKHSLWVVNRGFVFLGICPHTFYLLEHKHFWHVDTNHAGEFVLSKFKIQRIRSVTAEYWWGHDQKSGNPLSHPLL